MASARDYYDILQQYQQRRDRAERLLIERKDEIYKLIPEIAEIDDQIRQLGMSISKAMLNHEINSQQAVDELEHKLEELRDRKRRLLISAGYSKDYLSPQYICKDCQDTGYIGTQKCHCLRQALIDRAYAQSNLGQMLKTQTFDTFDITRYSDQPIDGEAMTPRENMEMIYAACLAFVEDFDQSPENLLFYGPTGLGKTFLSSCIARELLDRGKTVLYQTAFSIFEILREYKFSLNKSDYIPQRFDMLLDVDLLIIDDLGTELNNSFISSELFNVLNSRLLAGKKTIISTNLTLSQLNDAYSERIISRIIGHYTILKFYGEDIRKQLA
ncbi:ATP-binding protein [Mahella sp.]|uniref:ATP-binding protein n=1 Tax=Mahella sp. TaxID=2798721 RepID=UPI0025BE122B|nr:ATP-binding protein [Mahella sp.]MBZ4666687.1 IstB domain protein ATP-binding protein [Mahella sp.]